MKDINIQGEGMPDFTSEQRDAAGQSVWCECSGDFTLPEYMPEISKMIKVEGRAIPSGKYIGAERAEFSGNVLYSIIYAGEDGLPYFTTLSCDYEYTVPLGETLSGGETEIYDEAWVESTSVRPSGPRKLSVKSKIKATPHVIYKKEADAEHNELLNSASLQKLCSTQRVVDIMHFESGEFELEESIKIDGASPEAELVGCEGNVLVSDVRVDFNSILCRGECECSIYYYDIEAGRRVFLCSKKKVPFEKEIPIYHTSDIQNARAYGKLITADVSSQGEGEQLLLSLTLNLCGEYISEREKVCVRDVYAEGAECDVQYQNESFERGVLCKNAHFSCHAQKKLEKDMNATVICTFSVPRIESFCVENGKANISGEIGIEALMCYSVEESCEYTVEHIAVDFKCELPTLSAAQKYSECINAEASGVRVRAEKDSLYADAELYLSAFVKGIDTERTVKSAETLEDIKDIEGDCVKIYYPDKNESLWSIGKKYAKSIEALSKVNSLDRSCPDSPDSLGGVRSLVIK